MVLTNKRQPPSLPPVVEVPKVKVPSVEVNAVEVSAVEVLVVKVLVVKVLVVETTGHTGAKISFNRNVDPFVLQGDLYTIITYCCQSTFYKT